MRELRCKVCGEVTTDELLRDSEVCKDCQDELDRFRNPDLVIALAEYFGVGVQDIVEIDYDIFKIDGIYYYVLNEDEANDRAEEYIRDTIWDFRPRYLADCTDLPEELFEVLAEHNRYEFNGYIIEQIIDKTCGMQYFIERTISGGGRGHFLNFYDGVEHEIGRVGDEYFYAYRRC